VVRPIRGSAPDSPTPPARRDISLRLALVSLIAGLLLATVAVVGTVVFINLGGSIEYLADQTLRRVAEQTATEVRNRLEPAVPVLLECRDQARRGLLPVGDPEALSDRLVERFRHESMLAWLSYGDANA
jgi:hypothetical protein